MFDLQEAKEMKEKFTLLHRGKGLRAARESAKMSLVEVANLAQVSVSLLSMYENGKRDLSLRTFARLQDVIIEMQFGGPKQIFAELTAIRKDIAAIKLLLAAPEKLEQIIKARRDAVFTSLVKANPELSDRRSTPEAIEHNAKVILACYEELYGRKPTDEDIAALRLA